MPGQRIGYVRVRTFDQNPERRLKDVPVDKTFTDKASGKDTQRPQLDALLGFVREGDTVLVHSMDRLARNLDDLRRLVQTLPIQPQAASSYAPATNPAISRTPIASTPAATG